MKNTLKHIALKNRVFYNISVDDFGIAYMSPKNTSYEECLMSAQEAAEEQKRQLIEKAVLLAFQMFNISDEEAITYKNSLEKC